MISVAEAEQLIRENMPDFGTCDLPINEAQGAVLRQSVVAERDQPPFDRVTMDGIAIHSRAWAAGTRTFHLQGTQAAGDPAMALAADDACIEIMTGAVLPEGCDCIIPVENTEKQDKTIHVAEETTASPRQYIHARGSDYREGEALLNPGTVIRAPEMAVLASAGKATVKVSRQPAFAVISVGDELVDAGKPIEPFQIRRSNDLAIVAGLTQRGYSQVASDHLPDDPAVLRERIGYHLRAADILILSGGVSMGKFDYIPGIMKALGVSLVLHKVSQRPGKPMWVGTHPSGRVIFALPGNPVSTLVCFIRYVVGAVAAAMGADPAPPERAILGETVVFKPALTYFLPVLLEHDQGARPVAQPRPTNTSGDFASLAGTTGFVELPREDVEFPEGFVANLYRW